MTKNDAVEAIVDCCEEIMEPLGLMNAAMEMLSEDTSISREDRDELNYWYMQLNGTGFIEDLVSVVKSIGGKYNE